ALRESEERLARIYSSANDGIIVLNPRNGKVVEANPQAARLLGCQLRSLVNKQLSEFCENCEDHLVRFAQMELTGMTGFTEEMVFKTMDGVSVPVEVSTSPLYL